MTRGVGKVRTTRRGMRTKLVMCHPMVVICAVGLLLSMSFTTRPLLAQHIPDTEGRTLQGENVAVPGILNQHPAFLILGFSQRSTDDARSWSKGLHQAEILQGRDDVYDLIMLERVPRLLRGLVERQIRNDVSPAVRSHFISLIHDEDRWRAFAHIDSDKDVYVVLVDQYGGLCWETHGPPSQKALAAAAGAMSTAIGATARSSATVRQGLLTPMGAVSSPMSLEQSRVGVGQ